MKISIYDKLLEYKVDVLKELAKLLALKNYSKLKKKELVDKIAERILDEEHAELIFLLTQDEEIGLFEAACNGQTIINEEQLKSFDFLYGKGYIFISEDLKVTVTEDVKEVYNRINTAEFKNKRERFKLVSDYCRASVRLYGVVPVEKLIEIFNGHNEIEATLEEIMDACEGSDIKNDDFTFHDGYVVGIELLENNGYEQLLKEQDDKPYYIPSKNEFLKYNEEMYYEITPQFNRLKECILALELTKDEELAYSICEGVQIAIILGAEVNDLFEEFEFKGVPIKNRKQVEKLLPHIGNLINHTRGIWNRGYTAKELDMIKGENKIVEFPTTSIREESEKKIGRNEPCPCGSGRKYKVCCGK